MFGLGIGEGLILLVIVLLLFGGRKLPELGSSLGKALTNFKKGMSEANQPESDPDKNKLENNNSGSDSDKDTNQA